MKPSLKAFSILKFHNFRLYWIALFLSQVGVQMQIVANNWQLYNITHSAASLGLIGFFGFLPIFLFSLPAGVIADRVDRKKLMIINQFLLSCGSLVLAITTLTNTITPTLLYAIFFLNTTVATFNLPALQSIVANIVPKEYFLNAVSISSLIRQTSLIAGPGIAGVMIATGGTESVYIANMVFFAMSVVTILFLTVPHRQHPEHVELNVKSILEGIHFVRKSDMIASTMLLDFFATFFSSAMTLLPIYAKDILKVGAAGLGPLYAAPSVGAVVAGLIFASLHKVRHQGKIVLGAVILYGAATIGFGFSTSLPLALFFLFLLGAADMVSTVIRNTIRQAMTPDYIRGRMSSINMIFFAGGPQLGEVEGGFLAAAIGAPLSVAIGGAATILTTLGIGYFVPRLRNYQNHEEKV